MLGLGKGGDDAAFVVKLINFDSLFADELIDVTLAT